MNTLTAKKFSLLLATVLLALGAMTPLEALAGLEGWERIRSEDGILVSRKEVEGSPFVAFRGEGDVSAPILSVASVLVDVPREQEWMDSVVEARILRKVSDTEYIMYSHLGTPPTMSDRDFVMDVTITINAPAQSVTVKMRSVDDPLAPKTGYVRAVLTDSVFVLSPATDGKGTHVVAEIHCDPKGSIASWIVNLFQRGWGYNTIKSLRKQVSKPGIPVPDLLRARLEGPTGNSASN
jgi:hypothetical protein